MLKFCKKKWKYKLPIWVGVLYFVLCLPFLTGMLIPSIHEGNAYSVFFVIVNMPVIVLFDKLTNLLTSTENLSVPNAIFIFITWLFWVLISFLIGIVIDTAKKTK